MVKEKPGRVVAFFNRAPAVLYRARLGWLLGAHFLLLTTTGRKSGRTHRTVLEVARRVDTAGGHTTFWVIASRGRHSDWYANALAGGPVSVTWKTRTFTPQVHALGADERAELLADYQGRHPRAAAMLGTALLGSEFTGDPAHIQRLAVELRALRLEVPAPDVTTAR